MNTEAETLAPETSEKEKINLSVEVAEKSACERHVTVTIPRSEIERYFSKQFDQLVPRAEIPGFRIGKAPRKLVEKKFRKQLAEQVKGSLLMDSLTQVNESQEFTAISEPDLDFEQVNIPDDGDLTYEFNIEVRPEFDLPKWEGMTLSRDEHEFTDKEIKNKLAEIALQYSDLIPIDEPIQANDFIVCNIISRHENKVVSKAEEVTIQIKSTLSVSDATIEGFDKLMIGAVADESRKISAEISEFADNESLRGKTVELEFEVLDVKRVELSDSEKLAKRLAFGSGAELEAEVRKQTESQLQYHQREQIRDQISQSLTQSATWELPPDLLRRQSKREVERAAMEMRSSGFDEANITKRLNLMRKNILQKTEMVLKEHFILEKIAEQENVEDLPGDYEMEIQQIADQQKDTPRRVRAMLERNGQMDSLRNMIIERKVINMITEKAKFKATKYKPEESSDTVGLNFFAGGAGNSIPAAKYDGGEAAPIPGMKPDRD